MKNSGYIGKVSNHGAQVVKGPNTAGGAKGGAVKRGADLRGGKTEKSGK